MFPAMLSIFQGVSLLRGVGILFGVVEVSLYDLCDKVGSVSSAKYRQNKVDSELSTQDSNVASMDDHWT